MSPALLFFAAVESALAASPRTLLVGAEVGPAMDGLRAEGARCYPAAGLCVLETRAAAADIAARPGVRYVEADRPLLERAPSPTQQLPGPPGGCSPWELSELNMSSVWSGGIDGSGEAVAVMDSGFRLSHEGLAGRISGQYDYGDDDGVPEVSWYSGIPGHGTFIAGIIAGREDGGRPGLAPGATLELLRIADSSGALYYSYAVEALAAMAEGDWAARVVNYSLAGSGPTAAFTDAVEALEGAGVLLVAAAGNCGYPSCADANNDSDPLYPASYSGEHILSVASAGPGGERNPYSHYGPQSVDLAAPGVDICSLGVDSDTETVVGSGTSYAAPMVAAAAALLWQAHPELTPSEVRAVITGTAASSPAWTGLTVSGGVLDVEAALAAPVPDLDTADGEHDLAAGADAWQLTVGNRGGEGAVALVLEFESGDSGALELSGDAGWALGLFSAGEAVTLPDGTSMTAAEPGVVLTGTLPADAETAVSVRTFAEGEGSWIIRAQVFSSAGLRSARQRHIITTTAAEGPGDTGAVDSGGDGSGSEGGGDGGGGEETEPGGCATLQAPAGWGMSGVVLLMLVGRRRRR